jgi:replication-associated recombination protein RarA
MDRWNSPSLFSEDTREPASPGEVSDVGSGVDGGVPLAERMRPRSLSEFVGQAHLVGEGRILRRLLAGGGIGAG